MNDEIQRSNRGQRNSTPLVPSWMPEMSNAPMTTPKSEQSAEERDKSPYWRGRKRALEMKTRGIDYEMVEGLCVEVESLRLTNQSTTAENEKLSKAVERLTSDVERLEARDILMPVVPQTAGEMRQMYPNIEIVGHEWDNRTTPENAVWLIGKLLARIKELEAEVERMKALLRRLIERNIWDRETKPELQHLGKTIRYCSICANGFGGHNSDCLIGETEIYLRELSSREQKGER